MDLMDAKKVKCCSRDTINSFPDEILAKIISFLPTKRAASTCLVSKRWRNLFALMLQLFSSQHHLYLDYSDLVYPEEGKRERKDVEKSFGDFVDKTLSSYNSIIKKLSLKCPRSCLHTETDQWLSHALERGGLVDLDMRIPIGVTRLQSKWPRVFTIKTLVKLTLEIERGPERISCYPLVFLPVLKSLFLHTAWYTCEDLCSKMSSCFPILEELSLQHLRGLPVNYPTLRRQRRDSKVYSISHKTLKRLTSHYNNSLDNCRYMRFNTPSLVYLDYSGFAPTSSSTANFLDSLVEAKLDVFLDSNLHHDVTLRQMDGVLVDLSTIMNWMRNVKTLSLSSASVKEMYSRCGGLPFFSNLVKLRFESNTEEGWEVLGRLLNKSPKLETLVLKGLHCVSSQGLCIDRNEVKVLEIYGFSGRDKEVRQVTCFLREMQFLQVMKVEIDADDGNKKLRLINHLLALPRCSSKLQFMFL